MTEKIIELLPSSDLKQKIKEVGHTFSENELLQIIERYAPTIDVKHDMMLQFAATAPEDVAALAREYVGYEKALIERLITKTPGAVYELSIKDTPDSFEEKYLADSFDSALGLIDKYYEEYERYSKKTEMTRYEIKKRRVFSEGDDFYDETYSKCTLNQEKQIMTVYDFESVDCRAEENFCSDCKEICYNRSDEVKYPNFAKNCHLIKFFDFNGKVQYGVNLEFNLYDCDFVEELYVLDLDTQCIKDRKFDYDTIFMAHCHIDLPRAFLASPDELDEKTRENYFALLEFINTCPEYMPLDKRIDLSAEQILEDYRPAFNELAK